MLLHHNITPPEFFGAWDPEMERICRLGREQVASLRDHVHLALADSEFSRALLGFISAIFLILSLGFFVWAPVVFPLFVLMISIYILVANYRRK